jgi:hypothetical protein
MTLNFTADQALLVKGGVVAAKLALSDYDSKDIKHNHSTHCLVCLSSGNAGGSFAWHALTE